MEHTAIGINVFAGAFTLGVERAGFKVLGQWEECDAHRRTFDLNFGTRIPRPLVISDWPTRTATPDLVYANPPCAPWSSARGSHAAGGQLDPRLEMTAHTMRAAMAMRPRAFVCESVTGAWQRGAEYYSEWAKRWIALGYGVTMLLTDALLHGLPSTRERFHFIAHHGAMTLREPDMRAFIPKTVRMAIGDLHDRFDAGIQHVPEHDRCMSMGDVIAGTAPGGKLRKTALAIRESGTQCRMSPFIAGRLVWDSPGPTIVKIAEMAHPERDRLITTREGLRLCGYPDTWMAADAHYPVSATQAVMPVMGEYLAGIALESFGADDARPELEVVDWRDLARPYRQRAVLEAMRDTEEGLWD